MTDQFELQIFTGKVYETVQTGDRRTLEPAFERMVSPRRLVLTRKNWPAKPAWRHGSRRGPYGVTDGSRARTEATCCEYLAWAREHGLKTVTVYRDSFGYRNAVQFERRVVDVDDFLGAAPAAETEE